MRLISHLTHKKTPKKWVFGFYLLSLVYPLILNSYLLVVGESVTAIVSKKNNPYVEEYLEDVKLNIDELGINIFIYTFSDKVYVGRTGLYNFGKINDAINILVNPSEPSDYVVPTFRNIYFSPSGLNTFVALFFATIYLYVMKDK